MLIRKALKYRLYPTPKQEQSLLFVLRRCRHLYNSAPRGAQGILPNVAKEFGVHATGR